MSFCSFPSGTDNFTAHQRIMHRVNLGGKIDRVDVLPPDHGSGWILKVEIDHDRHDDIRHRVIFDRIDECTLNEAIEEAIDRYDLPACRDDFGAVKREGFAMWERSVGDES